MTPGGFAGSCEPLFVKLTHSSRWTGHTPADRLCTANMAHTEVSKRAKTEGFHWSFRRRVRLVLLVFDSPGGAVFSMPSCSAVQGEAGVDVCFVRRRETLKQEKT